MATLPISKVVVDQQDIYNELARRLTEKGTWKDLLPTNVGSTILDIASGAATVNQHYINVSLREAFLSTARRDSSIFEGARSLGVRIARKSSAGVSVYLTNNLATVKFIPPYSAFLVGTEYYFNREQLMLAPGQTLDVVQLYQGEIRTVSFDVDTLTAGELQTFKLNEPGFVVSNDDLVVWTEDKVSGDATIWTRTDVALYELSSTDLAYYEFTAGNGDVAMMFGTGEFGAKLPSGSVLRVRYVRTKGANAIGISGERVRLESQLEINGFSTSNVSGGGNEKSALYYKLFAPVLFRSKRKAISPTDVRAHIIALSGVADVALFFQKDIAPNDPMWQNVMRICILPENSDTLGGANPNPRSAAWSALLNSLPEKLQAMAQLQSWNPTKLFVPVSVLLAVDPDVDPGEMRILVTERILKLFQRKPGILGRRLSKSDIENACRLPGVDYIEVQSPVEEIIPHDRTQYVALDGTPLVNIVYSERKTGAIGAY